MGIKKNIIIFSLIFGLILSIVTVGALMISNLNNQNNITLQEIEPDYTIGRCVLWNVTEGLENLEAIGSLNYYTNEYLTDIDIIQICNNLKKDNMYCDIYKFEETYMDLKLINTTCIDKWYNGELTLSEVDKCEYQAYGYCISKMITMDGW